MTPRISLWFVLLLGAASAAPPPAPKSVRVFVALCDNKTQGIEPVGERIGNGDDPGANLYWGCDDGFGSYFRRSRKWKVIESKENVSDTILRRMHLRHVDGDVDVVAEAYRGSEIAKCLEAFEKAAGSGEHALVAFIGHNVLMDTAVPEAKGVESNSTQAVVLCCLSDRYFRPRLERLGCEPLLLTQQLMYPGSFLLHDMIEVWKRGGSTAELREAGGRAYARNQKISVAAGTNIFAPPKQKGGDASALPAAPAERPLTLPKPTMIRLANVLTLSLLMAAVGWADDWPQWRGPNRDGVWDETDLMQSFPPGGLKVRWRAPAGWGFSSPVVAGGRVFLADSELMKPKARERVRCLDEVTGKAIWTHSYDVAYADWAFDPTQEIGPVATPIVQSGKLYTLGRLGHLLCLETGKGEVLWQRDLGKDYQVAFSPGTPSPLIERDLLIVFIGGKPEACVVALDQDTGKEVWKALDEKLTFGSPIVISSGGKRQLIVWTQESVTCLDPALGTTYWRQRLLTSGDYAVSTPVFDKDRLLIGGMMFQLDSDKPAAAVLWPDSRATSRRILSNTSTPLVRGDLVFSGKSSGEFVCLEAGTGTQVWESSKVTDLKNGASIHLTANGDSVLLFTDRGELIRARLISQGYEELSRVAVLEPTMPFGARKVAWSPPAYANGHIFVRNGKELICASLAAKP